MHSHCSLERKSSIYKLLTCYGMHSIQSQSNIYNCNVQCSIHLRAACKSVHCSYCILYIRSQYKYRDFLGGISLGGITTVERFLQMEVSRTRLYTFITSITRSSCEKCNYRPSGRNRTCGTAFPVQRSNQLSASPVVEPYVVEPYNHKLIIVYMYLNSGWCQYICYMGKYRDFGHLTRWN